MELNEEQKAALLEALQQLKAGHIPRDYVGICSNLDFMINSGLGYELVDTYKFVEEYSLSWPHHSGSVCYPIIPIAGVKPWENKDRISLVDWLIQVIS